MVHVFKRKHLLTILTIFTIAPIETQSACQNSMQNCKTCDANGLCIKCRVEFYLDSGVCKACYTSCNQIGNKHENCENCKNKGCFKPTGQSEKCKSCSEGLPGCNKCDSSNVCERCAAGYDLENKACVACTNRTCTARTLATCQTDGIADGIKCIGCFWNSGKCKKCPAGCMECKTATKCDRCDDNFYLDSVQPRAGTCKSCGKCINLGKENCENCRPNCRWILESSSCTGCKTKFCIKCHVDKCIECAKGFSLIEKFKNDPDPTCIDEGKPLRDLEPVTDCTDDFIRKCNGHCVVVGVRAQCKCKRAEIYGRYCQDDRSAAAPSLIDLRFLQFFFSVFIARLSN